MTIIDTVKYEIKSLICKFEALQCEWLPSIAWFDFLKHYRVLDAQIWELLLKHYMNFLNISGDGYIE